MSNYFVFTPDSGSAIDSSQYNVLLSGLGTYGAPERDVTAVSIPGRNGDLIFDNGRFFNAEVFYDCGMSRTFQSDFDTFRSLMMLNSTTYGWLTDTYHPSEKRRARVARIEEISTTAANLGGKFRVVFDCKPQRYLASGDQLIQIGYNGAAVTVNNPSAYPAYPIFYFEPALARRVNSAEVSISSTVDNVTTTRTALVSAPANDYFRNNFVIDCEMKSGYYKTATISYPLVVQRMTSEFPFLVPGNNSVTITLTSMSGYSPSADVFYKLRNYNI